MTSAAPHSVILASLMLLASGCLERSSPRCDCPSDGDGVTGGRVLLQPVFEGSKYGNESFVTWTHDVLDSGPNQLLLVACNTDHPSLHPAAVTANGEDMEKVAQQDAPNYGALSVWVLAPASPGANTIEVTYSQNAPGLARSISFENVALPGPVNHVAGGTHSGQGSASMASGARDYPLMLVSWGNNQSTTWRSSELEIWDDTNPGGGNSLGGAAATLPGADVVAFSWETTSGDGTSGANIALNIRAP